MRAGAGKQHVCVLFAGSGSFCFAGLLGGDSPLWRPASKQTSAGRRCAPASCAAMTTCASSACDTASTARRRPCTTVSRPGATQAMPGRPGILSAFARDATTRCTTATASSSRRWASSGDSAPSGASPPSRDFQRLPSGDRRGGTLSNRAEFSARGDRAGTKQPGARAGTLEAAFLRPCDFCAKTNHSRPKTWQEPCPNWTQKERET